MPTTTTETMPETAIRAQTELYREIILRAERQRQVQDGPFDPVNLFETRPVTEDEAQAAANEAAANFERIVRGRNEFGLEGAFLLLGCDLIREITR